MTNVIPFSMHTRFLMRTSFLFPLIAFLANAAATENAVVADWPRLLGPAHNGTTPETGLLRKLPAGGPRIVWETPIGSGFGGPAIVGKRLVLFHRVEEREIVECRDAEAGAPIW